jgi:hypothetical protein
MSLCGFDETHRMGFASAVSAATSPDVGGGGCCRLFLFGGDAGRKTSMKIRQVFHLPL